MAALEFQDALMASQLDLVQPHLPDLNTNSDYAVTYSFALIYNFLLQED